jgi:dTDP-4-dehydrorhamnose reductase
VINIPKLKVLIIGTGGYIGSNLFLYLTKKHYDVYGTINKTPFNPECQEQKIFQLDILNPSSIEDLLKMVSPDIIIHAAGLNSLVECEKNQDLAIKLNVDATSNIVKSIKKVNSNIKLVFISSDYVFDGISGDYKETDTVNPTTYYGRTKVLAENEISSNLKNFIICRTANVYGNGGNFFRFVYDNLNKKNPIEVFDDVHYTPTYINYFLDSIECLLQQNFKGIIHLAGKEKTTRYDFAKIVANLLNVNLSIIKPVPQPPTGLIAKNSTLNTEYSRKIIANYNPTIEKSLMFCLGYLINPYFFYQDERGKLTGIIQEHIWEEINYIESGKGTFRGNHYHKSTIEGFFIIKGDIIVTLKDLHSNEIRRFKVDTGDFFIVSPNTNHQFEVITESKWINMLSKSMMGDVKDIYRE